MTNDNEANLQIRIETDDEDTPEEGAPAWMTTFGDMMSLLLCFFILMFSMSEIKVEKFLLAAESLRAGLNHGPSPMLEGAGMGGHTIVDTDVLTSDPAKMDITITMDDVDNFLELIRNRLDVFIAENGLSETVEVERDADGVTLSIQDVVLFDVGSADVQSASLIVMQELGRLVAEFDMPVVVAGHTDDQPIHTWLYPSNWELSSARASTVARIILGQGLEPTRVHVEGHAEFRPTASNETIEGREKNRRVELLYTRQNVRSQMIEHKKQELTSPPPNESVEDPADVSSKDISSPDVGSQGAENDPSQ